jgi:hypothetical protein
MFRVRACGNSRPTKRATFSIPIALSWILHSPGLSAGHLRGRLAIGERHGETPAMITSGIYITRIRTGFGIDDLEA